jgi:hypothetical protein
MLRAKNSIAAHHENSEYPERPASGGGTLLFVVLGKGLPLFG